MKRDWLQISSNIAIIVGLIIVTFELTQSHQHARALLVNDDYVSIRAHHLALLGENPARAIAKAKSNPDDLTEEEKIVVNSHLMALYLQLDAYEYIERTAGTLYYDDWKDVVPVLLQREFNFQYAQTWWRNERAIEKKWSSELGEMFDEALLPENAK